MIKEIREKKFEFKQMGFGMIEILVAVTVGIVLFLGLQQYLNISLTYANRDTNKTEALYLAKSMLEQARAVRDENWGSIFNPSIDANGKYHFINDGTVSPDKWKTQAGTLVSGKYTMWLKNYEVSRNDTNKDINTDPYAIGVSIDSNTLKITASISWNERGSAKQIDLFEYLANFK
jgi:type II secretory pathway pseudopilin PulG